MTYNPQIISKTEATQIALRHFGISGIISEFPENNFQSFKITTSKQDCFILRTGPPKAVSESLTCIYHLINHLKKKKVIYALPEFLTDKHGQIWSACQTNNKKNYVASVQTCISGRPWHEVNPQLDDFRFRLGEFIGTLTADLADFTCEVTNTKKPSAIKETELSNRTSEENQLLQKYQKAFSNTHNDLRKGFFIKNHSLHSILVNNDVIQPRITGLKIFNEVENTPIVNQLAYISVLGACNQIQPLPAISPIVKGFHSTFQLQEIELKQLYSAIGLSAVYILTQTSIKETNQKYSLWEFLKKWEALAPEFVHYNFRAACGFEPHPEAHEFHSWLKQKKFKLSQLFPEVNQNQITNLDLSVSCPWLGNAIDINNLKHFEKQLTQLQKLHPNTILSGGYLEPRAIYTSSAYDTIGNTGRLSRTIHLGVDYWLPAHTAVHAPFEGEIVTATNAKGSKNYGGLIILKHNFHSKPFYSLYGHLSVGSTLKHRKGDHIKSGAFLAELGTTRDNGNWVPHLHFQIMLSLLNFKDDFPGVAYIQELDIWKSLCPNPNLFFNSEYISKPITEHPQFVASSGVYLLDEHGTKYLNLKNNIDKKTFKDANIFDFILSELTPFAGSVSLFKISAIVPNTITLEFLNRNGNTKITPAKYVLQRMFYFKIVLEHHPTNKNIIPIVLPPGFTKTHALDLIFYLSKILNEDFITFNQMV